MVSESGTRLRVGNSQRCVGKPNDLEQNAEETLTTRDGPRPDAGRVNFEKEVTMKSRSLVLLAVGFVTASAVFAALAGGYLSGSAGALSSVAAVENINGARTAIKFSASPTPDGGYSSLGSVSLAANSSYVLNATVGLQSTAGVPASVECILQAPNEPWDAQNASFGAGVKGTTIHELALQAVSNTTGTGAGVAALSCRVTGSAADGLVIAHDARITAIPVDVATNNLKTAKQP
jgi:hypothetical protein